MDAEAGAARARSRTSRSRLGARPRPQARDELRARRRVLRRGDLHGRRRRPDLEGARPRALRRADADDRRGREHLCRGRAGGGARGRAGRGRRSAARSCAGGGTRRGAAPESQTLDAEAAAAAMDAATAGAESGEPTVRGGRSRAGTGGAGGERRRRPPPTSRTCSSPETPATKPAKGESRHWVVRRAKERKTPAVEAEGGQPTIWLNRSLGDPTPPAKRLSPKFAKNLQRISAVNGVSWALVLGVLRAEGARDRVPATIKELNALAGGLAKRGAADSEWNAALALSGRTGFADRAVALANYNRAVGLEALVEGSRGREAEAHAAAPRGRAGDDLLRRPRRPRARPHRRAHGRRDLRTSPSRSAR